MALTATLGALFFSEVMWFVPCELCWYQRIFMFPLVFILAVGLATSDMRVFVYAVPIVVGGWSVALYHNLLYLGFIPPALQPCGQGPSCAEVNLNLFDFISIPLLSLLAFTAIAALLFVKKGALK
ncbi:disulfide bond formation protein B [Pollutimonas subterranea]|uniref:Disulfide bond formation protein B n=1 Tax=Pollutimonas subterranea TaxID=2045210 RepID=A0A2N4TYL7_9BURK|nr:disulfide bond formation protein B [Pollutimonas subterranea]PLC47857.1 disulfide bond formation protein B [Pollutimonas subterranea]